MSVSNLDVEDLPTTNSLSEIALCLLDAYRDAEEAVIYEMSGNIAFDIKQLRALVNRIEQRIQELSAP